MSILNRLWQPAPTYGFPSPENVATSDTLILTRRALVIVALFLSVLGLGIQCYQYLLLEAYFDHIEGNVLINGWQWAHGAPLYELLDGMPKLANLYGPLTYVVQTPVLLLFGAGVTASKATSLLALMATVGVMGAHLFHRSSPRQALHGCFYLGAGLLLFGARGFWLHPDPFELLLVAVAVALTAERRGALLVGVCIGLAVNFKVHAFVYFLPILGDLWWIGGWRILPIAAICSGATFLAPFLAPGISLPDYVVTLSQQVAEQSPSSSLTFLNVIYIAVLILPLVLPLVARHHPTRDRIYAWATLASLAALVYPASMPGAGPHHFLPLVPVFAEARRRLQSQSIAAEFAPLLMLFLGYFAMRGTLDHMGSKKGWDLISSEALALARRSPVQSVHIGYGDNSRSYEISQLSKTVLAFNSYPAVVDAQILMELRQSGAEASARWVPYLAQCRIERWLLPKGEQPFATLSYYYDGGRLFSEEFRRTFFRHYKLVASSEHFDVWDCAHQKG
jgi:hypothetical protein